MLHFSGAIQNTIPQLSGPHWPTMARFYTTIYICKGSCRFIEISHRFFARVQMFLNAPDIKFTSLWCSIIYAIAIFAIVNKWLSSLVRAATRIACMMYLSIWLNLASITTPQTPYKSLVKWQISWSNSNDKHKFFPHDIAEHNNTFCGIYAKYAPRSELKLIPGHIICF